MLWVVVGGVSQERDRRGRGGEDGLSGWSSRESRSHVCVVCMHPIPHSACWRSEFGYDGLCDDDYSITIFQNQPVQIREGNPAYALSLRWQCWTLHGW